MICAMMLTAISSGVTDPIGRPTGMMTLIISSGEKPRSLNSAYTIPFFRVLPTNPI